MNDQFHPEEEKRLARDIDKALRPLDEEPSVRISPESIVSRLREEQTPRPLPFYRQKRWIAALSSLAACAAVVIAAAAGGLLRTKNGGELNVAPAGSPDASYQEDVTASKTTVPVDGSYDSNAGGAAAVATTTVVFTDGPNATQNAATQEGEDAQSTAACNKATQTGAGGTRPPADSGKSEGAAGENPSDTLRSALLSDDEAARLAQDGALLVDVRSAEAYRLGHRDGAVHLPLDAIRRGEYGGLSAASPLIVYGADAADGEAAALALLAAGYRVEGYLSGYAA